MYGSWKPEWLSKWILLGITVAIGYYNYATWEFKKFTKLGIKGPKPVPIFGNVLELRRKGFGKYDLELKQKYGLVVGCFVGRLPMLLIYDTKILKQILIKDFHIFTNHMYRDVLEPPCSEMVLFLEDNHWRHVRAILTQTFSTGKIKKMFIHINRCCNTLCDNLLQKAKFDEVFDLRELCGAYTMDVIASTAFGIEIDSHNNPKNDFVVKATELSKFRITASLIILMLCPPLYKVLNYFGLTSLVNKSVLEFFSNAMKKAMEGREKGCADDVKISHISGLTHNELLAQGLLFFSAGFETTANTLSLLGYHLATHPDIQERLHDEISKRLGSNEPTYDSLNDLVFLEMCLSETLRMHPPGARTDRVTAEDVVIDGLFIPKGMLVVVPIHAIQNDPEYWDKPKEFHPDRFSPSVRSSIEPLRYMPFGVGPRNCIGMRLAILELKMATVKMLRKYKFVACKETEVPLVLEAFATKGKNGIKLKVEERC